MKSSSLRKVIRSKDSSKILLIEILFKNEDCKRITKRFTKILQSIFNFTDWTDVLTMSSSRVSTVHVKLHVPGSVCFPT